MRSMLSVAVVSAVLVAGCSKPTADEYFAQGQRAEASARAAADTLNDRTKLGELFLPALDSYLELVREYPQHPLAGDALFLTATIQQNDLTEPAAAVETYKQYTRSFRGGSKAPVATFLVGYLYNNELQNLDSAAVWYRRFLEQYPSNEMAASAQFELDNLGKTADELLQMRVATTEGGKSGDAKKKSGKK